MFLEIECSRGIKIMKMREAYFLKKIRDFRYVVISIKNTIMIIPEGIEESFQANWRTEKNCNLSVWISIFM